MGDGNYFGPWQLDDRTPLWDKFEIGKRDKWYTYTANLLKPKNETPVESKKEIVVEQRTEEIQEDTREAFPKIPQRLYWDPPRTFESFLSSPKFILGPWPSVPVPLEDAIAAANPVKKPVGESNSSRRQKKS